MSLERPLAPYRVLEIATGAGSHCARILRDLGCEVVKVEPPEGDPMRRERPFVDGIGVSFAWYNAGKKGVTLDFEDPANQAMLADALADFDVLVDGNAPGWLAAHGLDPEVLRERYPELIITSVSHFGQTGPYRDWHGSGLVEYAMAGSLIRCGLPDRPPTAPPCNLPYAIAGITAAGATVVALYQRGRTGQGDWIDAAVLDAILAQADWTVPGVASGGRAKRAGAGPLFQLYPAADGWVRVINLSMRQWESLKEWLGQPEELQGPEWLNPLYRGAHLDIQEKVFERAFLGRDKRELYQDGQAHGVGIVPIYEPAEVMEDDHFVDRGTFAPVTLPSGRAVRAPASYARMNDQRPQPLPAPPELGGDPAILKGSRAPLTPTGDSGYPLAGLRVVEVGSGAVAPEVTRLLGELGADVIKLESQKQIDFMRLQGGGNLEASMGWSSSNRNKRSVLVDMKSDAGKAIGLRLCETADIIVENNTGGVMDRLGLGYAALSAKNPKLVYLSSQAFGATGPAAGYGGFGPTNQGISGTSFMWNHPDVRKPEGTQVIHPDHLLGRMGKTAILSALDEARRTGQGQHIDMGQAEFAMACIGEAFMEADAGNEVLPRGNSSPAGAPHGVFPCVGEDEWIAITVETDAHWQALKSVVGEEMWDLEQYDTVEGRFEDRDLIEAQLGAFTSQLGSHVLMRRFQAAGVPAGAAQRTVEAVADVHVQRRPFLTQVTHPVLGTTWMEGIPFATQNLKHAPAQRAPLWGEHTDDVLSEWLGMDGAAIAQAREAGALT